MTTTCGSGRICGKVALRSCTCKVARILAGPAASVSGELREDIFRDRTGGLRRPGSPASGVAGSPRSPVLPSVMLRKRAVGAAGIGLIGLVTVLAGAAAALPPERIAEVSKLVEDVRGRRY